MTNLRVGVIGAGKISSFFHLPILQYIDNTDIVFLADIKETTILARSYHTKPIKVKDDLRQLPDCDVVLLALPVSVRAPYIREYAKRGAAIFSEKPFAVSTSAHNSLLEVTNRITCNYHRVFYGSITQIKKLITSRLLGQLREIRISEGGIVGRTGKEKGSYQNNLELSGGGILIESGCHTLSQVASIFEEYEISISNASVEYQDGFDVDMHIECLLSLNNNTYPLYFDLSAVRPLRTVSVYVFDHGMATFDHTKVDAPVAIYSSDLREKSALRFQLQPEAYEPRSNHQAFYLKWRSFLTQVQQGTIFDNAQETSLVTTQLIEEIYSRTRANTKD